MISKKLPTSPFEARFRFAAPGTFRSLGLRHCVRLAPYSHLRKGCKNA